MPWPECGFRQADEGRDIIRCGFHSPIPPVTTAEKIHYPAGEDDLAQVGAGDA
jgi:hypothetical protein